ncbi:MAG: hypothetical protein LN416_06615 [Candidatus Thermoplasmatota archaeon]|nr:hypothetical protein [Candidatus Thermoplasmatota archaeon]
MQREHKRAVRHRIGAVLVILALVLALASLGLLIYLVTLPPPPGPHCGYGSTIADFEGMETLGGYEFSIRFVAEIKPLDCFKVVVIKDGTSLFPDLPTNVTEGVMGAIQGGESLSFTDSNGDGKLTRGDYFALERVDPDTVYELVLLWGANHNKISSETIQTP